MVRNNYNSRFLREVSFWAPWKILLVIGLMLLASFFEGTALAMLFPLLNLVGVGGAEKIGAVSGSISAGLAKYGITLTLPLAAGLFVGMILIQQVFFLGQSWYAAGLQVDLATRWRKRLTDALLRSEWLYFTRKNAGELTHVLTVDVTHASFLINFATQILSLTVTVLVYLAASWITSWQITLILMGSGTAIVAATQFLVRRPGRLTACHADQFKRYSSLSGEVLSGMKLVRSMDGAAAVRNSLFPIIDAAKLTEQKIYVHPAILRASFEFTAAATLMGTLVVSTAFLHTGGATVLLIAALFIRLYPRISTTLQNVHSFRLYLAYYKVVSDALDEAENTAEPRPTAVKTTYRISPPTIEFRSVQVKYGDVAAIEGVSMIIPAREIIALVGRSGAGKSTLVDSLLRLVPCSAGGIYVDNRPLTEIEIASWRRSIGYVPQDTFLFNASIRDNIAFAQPQATMEDIRLAAQNAQLETFIETLPAGYDTLVGDRGVVLSGGQRQRVGIARALLGGKTLLILDEATSSLDSETEAAIMRDIEGLHGKITIVLIAHRLSTLRSADRIIVLENGRVIEEGNWDLLTRSGGLFQQLWTLQNREGRFAPHLDA